ncbi:MAG: MlaD family protein [Candidatus Tectimicrobiota bacterium]
MDYFRADVKVGVLIFIALVFFIVAAIVVGGVREWFTPAQQYTVLLPNANLLRRRAKVSYAGSPVGEVMAITVHDNALWKQHYPNYPVATTIVVRSNVTLRTDARVEMRTDGFIGDRYLDIAPGYGQPLAPEQPILGSIGGVEGILMGLSGLGGGLGEVSAALRGILAGGSQEQSLPMTLGSLRQLLDDLRPQLVDLAQALTGLTSNVQQDITSLSSKAIRTMEGLDQAVAENSIALQRLMRELHTSLGTVNTTMTAAQATLASAKTLLHSTQGDSTRLLAQLRDLSGTLQRQTHATLASLQQALARLDGLLAHNDRNLYSSVEALRDTAESLQAAARQVRANPAVLLWGTGTPPDTEATRPADAAIRALQDRGRVGRYDKLQ